MFKCVKWDLLVFSDHQAIILIIIFLLDLWNNSVEIEQQVSQGEAASC